MAGLISCDDHMDLSQLPADLWTTRLGASLLDRAPHVEERDGQSWVCDGKVWGRWDGKPPATGSVRPVKALYNAFDRAGIYNQSTRRPAVLELRLADMDRDGVETQVIFGSIFQISTDDSALAAEEAGDKLSEDELIATCILLLIAGHETTVNLIGNGTLALLRHREELRRLRETPGLITSAVEELLRYDGPVQRTARITSTEVTIGGRTIAKDEMVMPFIGAADRDPAQFPDPDRLALGRADNRHIAFGWGIHFCLGAPLARVEGQIAIDTLVRRLPRLTLVDDEPEYRQSLTLRGLKALPVTF
jgi:Cytochrome P450